MMDLPAASWIGVFAHPDDEWVAGWPIFQRQDLTRGVIFFVGDNRTTGGGGEPTAWRSRLANALEELGIHFLGCLDCEPDFYRRPRSERGLWRAKLTTLLAEARGRALFSCAGLITHNPMGEYGHPDHVEVHRAVVDVCVHPVLISDLCDANPVSDHARRIFYRGKAYGPYCLDRDRWLAARSAYERELKWTGHAWPGQELARLFEL